MPRTLNLYNLCNSSPEGKRQPALSSRGSATDCCRMCGKDKKGSFPLRRLRAGNARETVGLWLPAAKFFIVCVPRRRVPRCGVAICASTTTNKAITVAAAGPLLAWGPPNCTTKLTAFFKTSSTLLAVAYRLRIATPFGRLQRLFCRRLELACTVAVLNPPSISSALTIVLELRSCEGRRRTLGLINLRCCWISLLVLLPRSVFNFGSTWLH